MREHETCIKVRFNEVDAYQVAWHGHYVAWMEVGRHELAARFGLDATQLAASGFLGPVVNLELKFIRPARFADELRVLTTVRRTEIATLEFACRILNADGDFCATGRTIHALTDLDSILQYQFPPVVAERLERMLAWLEG